MTPPPLPPHLAVFGLAQMHYVARALHVVTYAGVADALGPDPLSAEALAAKTGTNADALHRILRMLAQFGVFEFSQAGWTHTPMSQSLRLDHPKSVGAFVRMMGDATNVNAAAMLSHSLASGDSTVNQLHPGGVWGYYEAHPDAARNFDAAMESKSADMIEGILPALDLSGVRVIADIGGGKGHILAALLDAHHDLDGILFDQPPVVAAAPDRPRMRKIGGNFFERSLPEADLYLLSHIIHDWPDEDAMQILRNIRAAAKPGARLALYEFILTEGPEPQPAKILDIVMLGITGGRERTAEQYAALFQATGWAPDGVQPVPPTPMGLFLARTA